MRLSIKCASVAFSVASLLACAIVVRRAPSSGERSALVRPNETSHHVWVTVARVPLNGALLYKFERFVHSLLEHSRGARLHLNVVTDADSEAAVRSVVDGLAEVDKRPKMLSTTYHDVDACADGIRDIVDCMTPFFSSKSDSYYSDVLFYLSLGLHKIAPIDQHMIVLFDCDIQFNSSIEFLFQEFTRFTPQNLFALAHELSSVYRHVLYNYRSKNPGTSFGSEPNYSLKNTTKNGFPGFNSGVVLLNLDRIRKSKLYDSLLNCENVKKLTEKYYFKGHLGDQDFFTLIGYENPELFHVLDCGWNRQLCKWWRRYENSAVFDRYFKCFSRVKIYHGNCNTNIPI